MAKGSDDVSSGDESGQLWLVLKGPDRSVKSHGELLPRRQTLWRTAGEAGPERGSPLDQHFREEMFLGRKVVVQRSERDTGLHGHVLDLNAFVFVPLQQHEAGIDDALSARANWPSVNTCGETGSAISNVSRWASSR